MITRNGYIGWTPDNIYGRDNEQTMVGDQIVVVLGCSTPLVVRPRGKYFEVVGEAFVQGMMDGEAMKKSLDAGTAQPQFFTFC